MAWRGWCWLCAASARVLLEHFALVGTGREALHANFELAARRGRARESREAPPPKARARDNSGVGPCHDARQGWSRKRDAQRRRSLAQCAARR